MKMHDFLLLSKEEQLDTVWDKAIFLRTLQDAKFRFNLYALENFYIEIKYDVKRNTILEKVVFKQVDLLDKYLF